MQSEIIYKPKYHNSWALVIGINKYTNASPLGYARNDAEAFADILKTKFQFPKDNITFLKDDEATAESIKNAFLQYTNEQVGPDDRIIVFFAGHGHTVTGNRGEVGYLVPVEGSSNNLATLIRWDELTRNADLIPAKHILFIMDACYSGLVINRLIPPGNKRFLKDMLQRYSRQALTAGKANEVVADSGGPRPGHSIFAGHLFNALDGAASTEEGVLTASGVMAYVYDRVAKDQYSKQTPHYGFLEGDGDFIFDYSKIDNELEETKIDKDVLIKIAPTVGISSLAEVTPSNEDLIKKYLSDLQFKIQLDDLVTSEVRHVLSRFGQEDFPTQTAKVNIKEIAERLRNYENIVSELQKLVILLARWGTVDHLPTLRKIFARLGETNLVLAGQDVWLGLRWYPLQLLLYLGGISALANENYENFTTICNANIGIRHGEHLNPEVIIPTVDGMLQVGRTGAWKILPGHENNYVPKSEYLFKVAQPPLEDFLFLGNDYEFLFDKVEVMFALVYADLTFHPPLNNRIWGPPGRFAWKYGQSKGRNPFADAVKEADRIKEQWPPIKCGLFQGSYKRFKEIADGYSELLNELNWY